MKVTWAFKAEDSDRDYVTLKAKEAGVSITEYMARMINAFHEGKIIFENGVFLSGDKKEEIDRYIESKESDLKWRFDEAGEKIKKYDDLKEENEFLKRRNKALEMTQDGAIVKEDIPKVEEVVENQQQAETETIIIEETPSNFPEKQKDLNLTQLYKMAEKRQITPQSILDKALKMYR